MTIRRLKRSGMIDMESNTTLVQQYPAHEAVPGEGEAPFPAVVVIHDIYGFNAQVRNFANRLAHEGFYAVAPNLYSHPFSTAPGSPPWMSAIVETSIQHERRAEAEARAAGLADSKAMEFLGAALDHLVLVPDADLGRIGLVGFGMGGRLAFLSACRFKERIRGAVIYSGAGIASRDPRRPLQSMPLLDYENLSCPLLLFYGTRDDRIGAQERSAVARVLAAGNKRYEIQVLAGAEHDFFNEEDPAESQPAADRMAWDSTLGFLRENLREDNPLYSPR